MWLIPQTKVANEIAHFDMARKELIYVTEYYQSGFSKYKGKFLNYSTNSFKESHIK